MNPIWEGGYSIWVLLLFSCEVVLFEYLQTDWTMICHQPIFSKPITRALPWWVHNYLSSEEFGVVTRTSWGPQNDPNAGRGVFHMGFIAFSMRSCTS